MKYNAKRITTKYGVIHRMISPLFNEDHITKTKNGKLMVVYEGSVWIEVSKEAAERRLDVMASGLSGKGVVVVGDLITSYGRDWAPKRDISIHDMDDVTSGDYLEYYLRITKSVSAGISKYEEKQLAVH